MTARAKPNAVITQFYAGAPSEPAFIAAMQAFGVMFSESGETRPGVGVRFHGPTRRRLTDAQLNAQGDVVAPPTFAEHPTWLVTVQGQLIEDMAAEGEALATTPGDLVALITANGTPVLIDGDQAMRIGDVWMFNGAPRGAMQIAGAQPSPDAQ